MPEPQSNGMIGRFVDNKLNIIDELIANIAPTDDGPNQTVVFTDHMIETIEQGDAMAATDASVKSRYLGGHWAIGDVNQCEMQEDSCWSNRWVQNTRLAGEHVAVLELVQAIVTNTKNLDEGKILVHVDSSQVSNALNMRTKDVKASMLAGDGGAFISQTHQIKENTKVRIECVHVRLNVTDSRERTTGEQLLIRCDDQSKISRKLCEKESRGEKLNVKRRVGININNECMDKAVSEVVKLHDSRNHANEYIKSKLKEKWKLVDVEDRHVFRYCTPSVLKCITGFNHHGERIKKMNKYQPEAKCPRCGEKEDWEHVIKCQNFRSEQTIFVTQIEKKMKK